MKPPCSRCSFTMCPRSPTWFHAGQLYMNSVYRDSNEPKDVKLSVLHASLRPVRFPLRYSSAHLRP
jgi:hypothetical protein